MKRTYQIREWKAIEQFRSHLSNDPGTIQMVLSLAEIAQLLRQGVSQLLHEAEKRLLLMIMDDEVAWLTGDRHAGRCDQEPQRWGRVRGSVVVQGQRLPNSQATGSRPTWGDEAGQLRAVPAGRGHATAGLGSHQAWTHDARLRLGCPGMWNCLRSPEIRRK
jgi:hypothetical protein